MIRNRLVANDDRNYCNSYPLTTWSCLIFNIPDSLLSSHECDLNDVGSFWTFTWRNHAYFHCVFWFLVTALSAIPRWLCRIWETCMNFGISEAQAEGSQGYLEHSGNGEGENIWEFLMESNCVYYFYLIFTIFIWSKCCIFVIDTDTEVKSLKITREGSTTMHVGSLWVT